MFVHAHKGATTVGAVGIAVISLHVILGAAAVITAAQWVSGAVIGLLLLAGATLHVLANRHVRRHPRKQ